MKDLKLLQILPSLESGGVEQGTIDVANYIGNKNFKSIIISNGGQMLRLLNLRKSKYFNLPVDSKNPIVMFQNVQKIRKIILENEINLVHVRSRAPAWSAYYATKNICALTSTFHNIYGYQNIFKKYYNLGLSKGNNIVAISNFVKNSISKIYKINEKKITVIYRGIDTKKFDPNINDEKKFSNFFYKFHIPSDKKIILYPARLTKWKGQIEFLDVLKSLDLNNLICYFIGDDKNKSYKLKLEKEIYKKKLQLNCKILGHVSSENMRLFYKCADLVISAPLKPEGFCRVVAEALSMKKIVLCYNFGGSKEQILDLDDFYAVEPFNRAQMIEKIQAGLVLSENKKQKMGDEARNCIKNKFDKEIMLENYLKFYKKNIL